MTTEKVCPLTTSKYFACFFWMQYDRLLQSFCNKKNFSWTHGIGYVIKVLGDWYLMRNYIKSIGVPKNKLIILNRIWWFLNNVSFFITTIFYSWYSIIVIFNWMCLYWIWSNGISSLNFVCLNPTQHVA